MNNCNDKTKIRCKKVDANCVNYGTALPEFSELGSCVTIAETTEELYSLIGGIKSEIELSTLEATCLTLPLTPTVKTLFQTLINTICTQQTQITNQASLIATIQAQIVAIQSNPCPQNQ